MEKWLVAGVLSIFALVTQAQTFHSLPYAPTQKGRTAPQEPQAAGFIVKFKSAKSGKNTSTTHLLAMNAEQTERFSGAARATLRYARQMSNGAVVMRSPVRQQAAEWKAAAARLMQLPEVEHAEPDWIVQISATPNDPRYNTYQWHYFAPTALYAGTPTLGGANLPAAWDITRGSANVVVAVVDTGITSHPELDANVLPGYDFISSTALSANGLPSNFVSNDGDGADANASDPGDWVTVQEKSLYSYCAGSSPSTLDPSSWHGTHVAGTIAAVANNSVGGSGVAPGVKILPVRTLGKCGGTTSDLIDAMRWAAGLAVAGAPNNPHPADIINLSLGASASCSSNLQAAVTEITNAGKLIVAAAGNSGSTSISSPANCTGVLAVTAHSIEGANAIYADNNARIDISAPGGGWGTSSNGGIYGVGYGVDSTLNTGSQNPVAPTYASYQGTSMATPHAAATAALLKSIMPSASPAQLITLIKSNSRTHPNGTYCGSNGIGAGTCGVGLLDATLALTAAGGNLPPTVIVSTSYQVVAPGSTVQLNASTSTAAAGKTLTSYQWQQSSGTPTVSLSGANTATAHFTAPSTGNFGFNISVTDSAGLTSLASATVRVNSPPVLQTLPSQSGLAGNPISFALGATDADNDTLNYITNSLPSGASFSASTGTFYWAAPVAGSYTFSVYANDGIANSNTVNVTLTVTNPPTTPPSISISNSQTTSPGSIVELDATNTVVAPGKTITSYYWQQDSGHPTVTINNTNSSIANFIAPASGNLGFTITVTDSDNLTAVAYTNVRINSPPVLANIADQTVSSGAAVTFTASATDVDGDAISYTIDTLPSGASFDTATGLFSWPSAVSGIYILALRASDGLTESPTTTMTLTVNTPSLSTPTDIAPSASSSGGGNTGWLGLFLLLSATLGLRRNRVNFDNKIK